MHVCMYVCMCFSLYVCDVHMYYVCVCIMYVYIHVYTSIGEVKDNAYHMRIKAQESKADCV